MNESFCFSESCGFPEKFSMPSPNWTSPPNLLWGYLGCTLQTVMHFHSTYHIHENVAAHGRFSQRKLASLVNAIEVNNCLSSIKMLNLGRSPSPSHLILATTATSCLVDNFVMRCWWFNKLAKSSWNAVWKISSLLGFYWCTLDFLGGMTQVLAFGIQKPTENVVIIFL